MKGNSLEGFFVFFFYDSVFKAPKSDTTEVGGGALDRAENFSTSCRI